MISNPLLTSGFFCASNEAAPETTPVKSDMHWFSRGSGVSEAQMKPISYKEITLFTIPSVISLTIEPLAQVIDNILIGHYDSLWLSGLAICTTVFASFTWIFNFLVHGVTARIGQAFGANDRTSMNEDFTIAVILSVVLGLLSMLILLVGQEYIFFKMMGTSSQVFEATSSYYFVRSIGMPFSILLHTLIAIMRGVKEINKSLRIVAIVAAINGLGSYLSLYVFDAGFVGVGVATTLSFVVGCILCLIDILAPSLGFKWSLTDKLTARFQSFGADAWHMGGRTFSLLSCFFVATALASRIGEKHLAAHQVIYQFWILVSFIVDGIAITANSLGAPLIGANRLDLFSQLGRKLLWLGLATPATPPTSSSS